MNDLKKEKRGQLPALLFDLLSFRIERTEYLDKLKIFKKKNIMYSRMLYKCYNIKYTNNIIKEEVM